MTGKLRMFQSSLTHYICSKKLENSDEVYFGKMTGKIKVFLSLTLYISCSKKLENSVEVYFGRSHPLTELRIAHPNVAFLGK